MMIIDKVIPDCEYCNDDTSLYVSIVMMIIDKVIPDCEYCNDDNRQSYTRL